MLSVFIRLADQFRQFVGTYRHPCMGALVDMVQRAIGVDLRFRETQFLVEPRQAYGFQVDQCADRQDIGHPWVRTELDRQVASSRVPAQDHLMPRNTQVINVGLEMLEQAANLADDLCHRGLRRERIFGQDDVEPRSQGTGGDEGEIFLAAILPIPAMDEDERRGVGFATGQPVITLPGTGAVRQIEPTGHRGIETGATRLQGCVDTGEIRHCLGVVIRRVELGLIHVAIENGHGHLRWKECLKGLGQRPAVRADVSVIRQVSGERLRCPRLLSVRGVPRVVGDCRQGGVRNAARMR
ncbi:hypothetical protein BK635_28410 [Pseudomonas chlororaphis]|nr:hypothetical protein BK635_28410 [Pseudomonas chlororaphis]